MSPQLVIILVVSGIVGFVALAGRFGVDSRQDELTCRDASGRSLPCPRPTWR